MGSLKIYTDENVDVRIAEGLRRRGIEAFSARERRALGSNDEEHFEKAIYFKLSSSRMAPILLRLQKI